MRRLWGGRSRRRFLGKLAEGGGRGCLKGTSGFGIKCFHYWPIL